MSPIKKHRRHIKKKMRLKKRNITERELFKHIFDRLTRRRKRIAKKEKEVEKKMSNALISSSSSSSSDAVTQAQTQAKIKEMENQRQKLKDEGEKIQELIKKLNEDRKHAIEHHHQRPPLLIEDNKEEKPTTPPSSTFQIKEALNTNARRQAKKINIERLYERLFASVGNKSEFINNVRALTGHSLPKVNARDAMADAIKHGLFDDEINKVLQSDLMREVNTSFDELKSQLVDHATRHGKDVNTSSLAEQLVSHMSPTGTPVSREAWGSPKPQLPPMDTSTKQPHEPTQPPSKEGKPKRQVALKNISGQGKKEGLWNTEINDMMSKHPEYLGTIANDEIPKIIDKVIPKSRGCFILNTDNHDKEGEHWVAIYYDARPEGDNTIEYYDSYGDEPSEKVLEDLKLLAKKLNAEKYLKLKVNKIREQGDSNNCGYFAMKFIMDRLRGQKFKEASGWDDHAKAEKDIERFKSQFGGKWTYLPSFGFVHPFPVPPEMEGSGIIDVLKEGWRRIKNFFSGRNEMSPRLKTFMESKDGMTPVDSIEVVRAPISAGVKKLMNIISLGKLEENQRKLNYDDVYHLAVLFNVNGKWFRFEKLPRWEYKEGKLSLASGVDTSKMEGIPVPLVDGKKISIAEIFMNAIKKVGEQKFFSYSATDNNCQNGLTQLLGSSGLLTEESRAFIKQNAVRLMENAGVLDKVSNFVTGLKHKIDGLFGKGHSIQSVLFDNNKWNKEKADKWLNKHNLKPIKEVHETKNKLRYRIREPDSAKRYRSKKIASKGITINFHED